MTDHIKPKEIAIEEKTRIVISVKLFIIMLSILLPSLIGIYVNNQLQHKELDQRINALELRMDRIEGKLDMILSMSGINPNSKEVKDYIYAQQHKDEAIKEISNDIAKMITDNIYNFKMMLSRPQEE